MYKKQMTAQKVICLLSMIAGVLVFIYALGLMTDLYESVFSAQTIESMAQKKVYPNIKTRNGDVYPPSGFDIYQDMQPFNRQLLLSGIGLILLSCLLFITNTASRRKYYIGNYVVTALNAAAQVAVAVWMHGEIAAFRAQYLKIDFAVLEWALNKLKKPFGVNTFWFDIHWAVLGMMILSAALLILNALWKTWLMKAERKLLAGEKEDAA